MWNEYVFGKQTLKQLAKKKDRSIEWVRQQLEKVEFEKKKIVPCATVFIPDTTFFGRTYGVCVFRAPHLKKNIWCTEVDKEIMATYYYGRKILENKGWTFTAVVVDGRRGMTTVFKDIPVQVCQFHQMKRVTTYLTSRPKIEAGRELRTLVLTLTKTDKPTFTASLTAWHTKWESFINQKTEYAFTNGKTKWHYTHKNVRSAYRSLETNLPYLFTYQKYPELNIPNTTNSLDGSFSALKKKLAVHHGLRKDRRYKAISKLLRDGA